MHTAARSQMQNWKHFLDAEPDLGPNLQRTYAAALQDPDLRDLQFQERIRLCLPQCRDFAEGIRAQFQSVNNDPERMIDTFCTEMLASRDQWTQDSLLQFIETEDNFIVDCENALNFVLASDRSSAPKSNFRNRVRTELARRIDVDPPHRK